MQLPAFSEPAQHNLDNATVNDERRPAPRRGGGAARPRLAGALPEEDFLWAVVAPIYHFVFEQVSMRAAPSSQWSSHLCDRSIYDDVNEFFWSRQKIDALLGGATATPGAAYARLRTALADRAKLSAALRKTFYERPTWLSVLHTYHRVVLLNALAVHVMACLSFAKQACEHEAEARALTRPRAQREAFRARPASKREVSRARR